MHDFNMQCIFDLARFSSFDVAPDVLPLSVILFVLFVGCLELVTWGLDSSECSEAEIRHDHHENEEQTT